MARLQQVQAASIAGQGKLPISESGNTFKPSGYKREHKAGMNAADGGHTSTPVPAELEVTLQASRAVNVQEINALDDMMITVTLADGSKHMMANAFTEEPDAIDDGNTKLKFIANESTKIA